MDNEMSQRLNRRSLRFFWTDVSKKDINITKFLNLLLKYNYKWFPNDLPELNLTETDKERFIQECSESIDPVDEINAHIIIEIIKDLFDEEVSKLEECSKKDSESDIPWFSLACQLFKQSSIPEDSPITNPSISSVAITSNILPSSVLNFKMTYASASTTDSSSSTPKVQQFSWTTLLPNYRKPPFYQEKNLTNPTISPKHVYDNGFFSKNVMPQYDFPILYPVCILPQFSLGLLKGSGFSCTQNENVTLFDLPVDFSSSDRENLHRPDNRHSNRTNSYHPYNHQSDRTNSNRPDNCHNQMIKQGRNSSQSDTSMNSIKKTATGLMVNNSLIKECENFTNNVFSREPFRSSTAGTTSTVFRDIPSTSFSTISGPALTNIGHSSFRKASTPSSRVSISKENRGFATPNPINSLPRPTLDNISYSSFREAATPSSNVSFSQPYRDFTTPSHINSLPRPTLKNISHSSFHEAATPSSKVSISPAYRHSTTPSPIYSLPRPTLTNIGNSSFRETSTPLSSRVFISKEYRDSNTPSPINSLPRPILTNNGNSSFRETSTPLSSRLSISKEYRDSNTPSLINSLPRPTLDNISYSSFREAATPSSNVSFSQPHLDFTTPSSINSLPRPTLTNISHSSFREASTPRSSRVSTSKAERYSLPLTVNRPRQFNVGSSLPSSTTITSKGGPLYLNTSTDPVRQQVSDSIVESTESAPLSSGVSIA